MARLEEIRARLDYFKRCFEDRAAEFQHLSRCQALLSLLDRGASREDYAPNMCGASERPLFYRFARLPYSYKPSKELRVGFSFMPCEEFGTLLGEVDETSFGQVGVSFSGSTYGEVEGFRPLLVIDMAGAVGKAHRRLES